MALAASAVVKGHNMAVMELSTVPEAFSVTWSNIKRCTKPNPAASSLLQPFHIISFASFISIINIILSIKNRVSTILWNIMKQVTFP